MAIRILLMTCETTRNTTKKILNFHFFYIFCASKVIDVVTISIELLVQHSSWQIYFHILISVLVKYYVLI